MIVVATHNNNRVLFKLLDSIIRYDSDEKMLVVSTSSSVYGRKLKKTILKKYGEKIIVASSLGRHYEMGAMLYAYKFHKEDEYLFLQDSLEVVSYNFVDLFRKVHAGNKNSIVPWIGVSPFGAGMNPYIRSEVSRIAGKNDIESNISIFFPLGSIFYTQRSVLSLIESRGFLNYLPTNKIGSQVCERLWGLWAYRSNIEVVPLFTDWLKLNQDGKMGMFKKKFLRRR